MGNQETPMESQNESLYDVLAQPSSDERPPPNTVFTATKETMDNDREDVEDDVIHLST